MTEPWSAQLTDDIFTVAWGDPDSGTLWLAAFLVDGSVDVDPISISNHGPEVPPVLGPGSIAPIPDVGHIVVWSSSLTGQDEIYAAVVNDNGIRIH